MEINDFDQVFRDFIAQPDFPCVGAKSALAQGNLKVLIARDLQSAWNDLAIHRELVDWSAKYQEERDGLRSLVVIFEEPTDLDELAFETALWERIQSLSDKDAWLAQPYDAAVSADPSDAHFSLSYGGSAFFVVGLHPNASRPARRFQRPAVVFNLHAQFECLREKGTYERMRERILERDFALAGSTNPMLARHGELSEARQYSGRESEPEWRCPFRDPRADQND